MKETIRSLIPVKAEQVGGEEVNAVSARAFYGFLEVATPFTMWFARRVEEYGFKEGSDFITSMLESTGGRPKTDYILTLDMAKELAMVERNEQGRKARQYFIEIEKAYRRQAENRPALPAPNNGLAVLRQTYELTLQNVQAVGQMLGVMEQQARRLEQQEDRLEAVEDKVERLTGGAGYYTALAYVRLRGLSASGELCRRLGLAAKQRSEVAGVPIYRVPDERWGRVNSYRQDVLEAALQEVRGQE